VRALALDWLYGFFLFNFDEFVYAADKLPCLLDGCMLLINIVFEVCIGFWGLLLLLFEKLD